MPSLTSSSSPSSYVSTLLISLILISLLNLVNGHGHLYSPEARGGCECNTCSHDCSVKDGPSDPYLHFPSGDKSVVKGSGLRSQIRTAKNTWTEFNPSRPNFVWRANVCGDRRVNSNPMKGDHMRGGKYYWPPHKPMIVKTYTAGSTLKVSINVVAHHNGYMELHLCDVAKCGGEISEMCFKNGHCHRLERHRTPDCQSGYSRKCGPIDENYKHRWYLPCSKNFDDNGWELLGGKSAAEFKIPRYLGCEHCVLHWYWTAANTCNPPGVVEYFDGPNRPRAWGQCKGQGGARGGVARDQPPCQGDRFPEEYYQCADVRVVRPGSAPLTQARSAPRREPDTPREPSSDPSSGRRRRSGGTQKLTKVTSTGSSYGRGGAVTGLHLVSRGLDMGPVHHGDKVDVSGLDQLTFGAKTRRKVNSVTFAIYHGSTLVASTTEVVKPFRMFAGRNPPYWESPLRNECFKVQVSGGGDIDTYDLCFV